MKFLALAWTLAALVLFHDARAVRDYLALTSSLGLRAQAEAPTPLKQTYPYFAFDAQTWVRHAIALDEGGGVRLRHTTMDNGPQGRAVHWNSAWAWTIAGAGHVYRAVTGVPIANAIERATLWLNPFTLLALMVVFSLWAFRHVGLQASLLVVAAMTLHERLTEGFFPSYVDHHGLLTISVFGVAMGAIALVRGRRAGAVFSALCGAFGLWVSAASVMPALVITAIAGALTTPRDPATARNWRLWGALGAGASLLFYLLEYFPQFVGVRLEANHPLHAMAWLAMGELVARRAERIARTPAATAWPWIALAALPATVFIGGTSVLSFTDPFMARLHAHYITEFQPLWSTLARAEGGMALRTGFLEAVPLMAALATIAVLRRRSPAALVFATLVAAALLAMAWWQSRWQLNASAGQVALLIVLLDLWTAGRPPAHRAAIAAVTVAVLFLPGAYVRYGGAHASLAARQVDRLQATNPLARDIAATLRASQPQGDIILLASPNASTQVGYYGRFKTLGTLYWENAEGLKAAAAMFSARDAGEARRLMRERGVTHVAMISEANFVREYHRLLDPGATDRDIDESFGWRLMIGERPPHWLEPIPYSPPLDLFAIGATVRLFKVR